VERHRIPVVVTTLLLVVLASPLLLFLPFDFNPLHLRNPKAASVATFLELRRDPQTGANAIEIMAANSGASDAIAQRLSSLPQVSRTVTLGSLAPGDQDEKLKLIEAATEDIEPALNPGEVAPLPTDEQNIEVLSSTAATLSTVAGNGRGPGAEAARRLSGLFLQLAKADLSVRNETEAAVVEPLRMSLDQLREELEPQRITTDTIPADLKKEWVTPDGRARVEVLPSGDPDDTKVLRDFVTAVLAIEPDATGPAVLLFEAGNTVVRAFIEAGMFALAAIALLLWITLRRIADVLLTLVPLVVRADVVSVVAADGRFWAAGLHRFAPRWGDVLIRFSFSAGARPMLYFAGLVIASALAYVPLAVAFTPSAWLAFGPFGFQLSRPLHYAVYFFAGVGIGACGIERGLFAPDGALVRRWTVWLVATLGSLLVWMSLTALTMAGPSSTSLGLQILDYLSFVLACFSSCFFVLALVLRFAGRRIPARKYDVDGKKSDCLGSRTRR
jgi:hypothetical protein